MTDTVAESATASDARSERLWIERIADALGLEALGRRMTGLDGLGIYLLVLVLWGLDSGVLGYFAYRHSGFLWITENPISGIALPGYLFVVWAARRLKRRYHSVTDSLPTADDVVADHQMGVGWTDRLLRAVGVPYTDEGIADQAFDRSIPPRLRAIVFAVALLFHVTWVGLSLRYAPENWTFMLETWGLPITLIRQGLIIPFGYYLISSELVSMVLAVHVVLPFEIRSSGRIDFEDPYGYAGLRPVGGLVKSSTLYYVVGLSFFAVFFTFSEGVRNQTIASTLTLIGTGLAIVLFVAPVYWLHRYMRAAKEAKIETIAGTVREIGPDNDDRMFPDTHVETPDHADEYTHEYIRLQQVQSTAEYPVDIAILQETIFVLVLPYLAHISSIFVFEHLHL
ncbi:MAG: hypothetical protein ABEJ57_01450 [Halobacteriaceae archaeon]